MLPRAPQLPIRPSRASPELHADHKHKRYGPANDVWALGTVFAEMTCGNRDPTVYVMIQELDITSEETFQTNLPELCANGRDLMRKMLKAEPMDRIAAADALCHPYFDGLHEQCEVVAKYLPHSMVRERAESTRACPRGLHRTPRSAAPPRVARARPKRFREAHCVPVARDRRDRSMFLLEVRPG